MAVRPVAWHVFAAYICDMPYLGTVQPLQRSWVRFAEMTRSNVITCQTPEAPCCAWPAGTAVRLLRELLALGVQPQQLAVTSSAPLQVGLERCNSPPCVNRLRQSS